MKELVAGYRRFKDNMTTEQAAIFDRLSTGQQPKAMFITCADSRVVPDVIMQCGPGDLFVSRNVGNVVPPYAAFTGGVSAAIEYAVVVLGVKHLIVCGHSDCGAMKAVLAPPKQRMRAVEAWLQHCQAALEVTLQLYPEMENSDQLTQLTRQNVLMQLTHLRSHPAVAAKLAEGSLQLHGWIFDIKTCDVIAWSAEANAFIPLEETRPVD